VNRRQILSGLALVVAGAGSSRAHTPFGQWVVYRKKHLLIGAHRADPETYALAKRLSAALGLHLPKAKSRVARAPTAGRLASLLGTDQLDVAVLAKSDAIAMRDGAGHFHPYGRIDLTLLTALSDHVLVAHARFPKRHAWLVAAALHESGLDPEPADGTGLDLHPGSQAFISGEPEPEPDPQ